MEIIKIHNKEKHIKLMELGEKCLQVKKWKGKRGWFLYYYEKNDTVVSVLNERPSSVWDGDLFAKAKY